MLKQSSIVRGCGRAALLWFAVCAGTACGGDDGANVVVQLEFPHESAATRTNTVHLWVLKTRDEMSTGCTALMALDTDPYSLQFERLADQVFLYPDEEAASKSVPNGDVVVYVEAVDLTGTAHLAGCAALPLDGTTEVPLVLRAPGTYDCNDPLADNGDPCDDGDFCTVGETCGSGGSCSGGSERSCAHLSDACNSASCDPEVGCVSEQLPDLTSCTDPFFCTTDEVCMDGQCVGVEPDCETGVEQCYAGFCNESISSCDTIPISGETCDDGNECTGSDTCSTGNCAGTPLTGSPCDDGDPCTMDTECSSSGLCDPFNVAPATDMDMDGNSPEGCGTGTGDDCDDNDANADPDIQEITGQMNADGMDVCSDGIDNDCDGAIDETVDDADGGCI